tara:strand:+ start:72 stop:431 length:360 start_codon:yes stop_codon:yes gene_type:complete
MATINTDIAQKIDIIVRENNSSTINLVITDSSGSPFNLEGYSITHIIYIDNVTHISKSEDSGITETTTGNAPGASGKITITFDTTDLSILPGSYKHKLTLSKESDVKTWMYGKFKINND